jgi:hypothetical protein
MALGLMLVLEGVLPFMAPKVWRQTFRRLIDFKDGQLRFMGLVSMVGGLILIIIVNKV